MRTLHTQSATLDLATGATVLSHSVTTATALADLLLAIGDGTNNLAAAAETTLTITITIDGVPVRGTDPTETVIVGRTRLVIPVDTFGVAAGSTVAVAITSDQAADSAVAVTATLRDGSPMQPATRGRQLDTNANGHVSRVTLTDTTTTSTDMRGTDGANTTTPPTAAAIAAQVAAPSAAEIAAAVAVTEFDNQLAAQIAAIYGVTNQIVIGSITINQPVVCGDQINIAAGSDYLAAIDTAITVPITTPYDIDGATITWHAVSGDQEITGTGIVVSAEVPKSVQLETTAELSDQAAGDYTYTITATKAGKSHQIGHGPLHLRIA